MSAIRFVPVALLLVLTGAPVFAQDSGGSSPRQGRGPSEFALRSAGDFTFIQSRPTGAFADNIGLGYGVNAAYLYQLDRDGILSLRADLGFLGYGHESKRVPLSSTIGGRIQVRVSTTNYIVPVSIGPQLTWPTGNVRPYVNGGFGGQFFYTQSSIDGNNGSTTDFSTTNQHDQTHAWVAGGGVYVPIHSRKVNVMLDAGVQYFTDGRAQYLRPGSIIDLPDAQIQINPLESDTHMLVVRLGVRVGAARR
ncbi:MAG TPA: hypothetical protein VL383_10810 [Gemmatimonadaceae bacterium]|jgi:hypothetical protein|nr:hypothetical protein [Gemmatimonadaceae bacterium]